MIQRLIQRLKALRKISINRVAAVITITFAFIAVITAIIGIIKRYEEFFGVLISDLLSYYIVLYIWDYRYPIFLSSLLLFLLVLYFLHTRKVTD